MRRLSQEEAFGLVGEEVPDQASDTGFCYHALLALMRQLDKEGKVLVFPVQTLVGACDGHQLNVEFLTDKQAFVIRLGEGIDYERHPMCAFGWSIEDDAA